MTLGTLVLFSSLIVIFGLVCGTINLVTAWRDPHRVHEDGDGSFARILVGGNAVQESIRMAVLVFFLWLNVEVARTSDLSEMVSIADRTTDILLGIEIFLAPNSVIGTIMIVKLSRVRERR